MFLNISIGDIMNLKKIALAALVTTGLLSSSLMADVRVEKSFGYSHIGTGDNLTANGASFGYGGIYTFDDGAVKNFGIGAEADFGLYSLDDSSNPDLNSYAYDYNFRGVVGYTFNHKVRAKVNLGYEFFVPGSSISMSGLTYGAAVSYDAFDSLGFELGYTGGSIEYSLINQSEDFNKLRLSIIWGF